MDADRGRDFDGPQLVDVCRGDRAPIVHPAISLPEGDLCEERRRRYVGVAIKPDADRTVFRNGHRRAVALMRGGYVEVFRRATEADEQLPIVWIDYGQCPTVVGADVDLCLADSEQPRLCVMPRWGFDGLLDQEQEVRVLCEQVIHCSLKSIGEIKYAVSFSVFHSLEVVVQRLDVLMEGFRALGRDAAGGTWNFPLKPFSIAM